MPNYDVFNGDADGICALHQLRMAEPVADAVPVTGVKRDIRLLSRLTTVEDADITVLDISLASNREALDKILAKNRVRYIDHHYADELPDSANLQATIDPAPEICTSLIVDRLLDGRFKPWAIVGAFGDNLHDAAREAAKSIALSEADIGKLRETGELLNYNGYGRTTDDLYFHPADLYNGVKSFTDPLEFHDSSNVLKTLKDGFNKDMGKARNTEPFRESTGGRIYMFPNASWSRRITGVYANEKAREKETMAHALLVDNGDGSYLVSVRAPLNNKTGADSLCRKFPTGGGRAAAAGINQLPEDMRENFLQAFTETFAT